MTDERTTRESAGAEPSPRPRPDCRRRRLVVAGVAVAVVVGVAGVAIALVGSGSAAAQRSASAAGAFAAPTGAVVDPYFHDSGEPTAIPYGKANAPVTLTVIEDFRCPACKVFEAILAPVYDAYVQAGKLRVLYHPVRLIDVNRKGTTGSMFAGSAAACAQDAGKFYAYHGALFANQPSETTDDYAQPDRLLAVARQIPGLDTPTFEQCVRSGRYETFVQQNWDDFRHHTQHISTPTLLLGGERLHLHGRTRAEFVQSFEDAIRGAGGGPPPASLEQAPSSSPASSG